MKIGLFGGTFNPIHNGHLALADEARLKFGLNEVWFIPAGDPYQKDKKDLLPASVRYNLVVDATNYIEWARVSSIEVLNKGPSYTYETLAKIKSQYPDNEFYLIVGADAFINIQTWYKWEELIQNCNIIVATRPGAPSCKWLIYDLKKKYGLDHIYRMEFSNELSSTRIRYKATNGSSYRFDVPYCVYKYMEKNHPYEKISNTSDNMSTL